MDIEGILAITLIFGGGTLFLLAYSPVGRALADRMRHKGSATAEIDPAVYHELDQLRADVSELQERVDFAERMLAKPAETGDKST